MDSLMPDDLRPSDEKLYDLNMLAVLGGCERTGGEMADLFRRAGFRPSRVLRMPDSWALFEGEPV